MAPRNTPNRQPPGHKFDHAEQFRSEIEERTAAGETCEQIASALRAKGVDITNKTISRRRVEWGLRKRPYSKMMGQKTQKARVKKPATKNAKQMQRKAEIEARTQRGESADEIAAALEAQGFDLKKGASTILRLQTTWGLIPPDQQRALKGSKKQLKVSKRETEREANKEQQTQTLHYPTNCNFGPKKRVNGNANDGDLPTAMDADSDTEPWVDTAGSPITARPTQGQVYQPPSVSVAAELMSVEFLVDLANSTLGAANNLKDMLLAYQAQQPTHGSTAGVPPTLEDLATARRKVREAAAVMHDLALDPAADGGAS